MSIFVSVASYCDPLLESTIDDLFAKADRPWALRVGVVDQAMSAEHRLRAGRWGSQLRHVGIDYRETLGVCWARSLAASLYRNEDWYFQIDSHMLFDPGWDSRLEAMAQGCAMGNERVILSSFPRAFEWIDGAPVKTRRPGTVVVHVLREDASFAPGSAQLCYRGISVPGTAPLPGCHVAAGCLFARGDLFSEVPYDPYLYFNEEEQSVAVRAFTHGWDIFHIADTPVFHLYAEGPDPSSPRPLHWDAGHQRLRTESYAVAQRRSRQRLLNLFRPHSGLGAYGLGRCRSLADYEAISGVDYAGRRIAGHAYTGRW